MTASKMISKALLLVSVAFLNIVGGSLFAADGEILVTLVRHADISLPARDRDPDLLPSGAERAALLGEAIAAKNVDTVFSTEYLRTKHTAEIAASKVGATTRVVGAARMGDLVAEIKANYRGKSVLVVGHSNTVPAIIEALGGPSLPNINEQEFDNIFEVRVVGDRADLVQGKYGRPSVVGH